MTTRGRDVFPLRFKNAATRQALKHLADQTGVPMTEIAERAIEHEIALQGSDLERRLTWARTFLASLENVETQLRTAREALSYEFEKLGEAGVRP